MLRLLKEIYRKCVDLMPDIWAIRTHYLRNIRRLPNLKSPVSLNEKINWRKLYQRDERFTLFADKITAKTQVLDLTGPDVINPTLWTGFDASTIPWETLPPPFVIKWNHSAGDALFVMNPSTMNRSDVEQTLVANRNKKHGHFSREWGYYEIKPMLMIEPMLLTKDLKPPEDFKFFVYHGRVHFIQVDLGRFTYHERCFFDRDWNYIDVKLTWPSPCDVPARPECFQRMIEVAEKIGGLFDFIRVDLYQLPPKVYFGEATFYPGAGYEPFHNDGDDFMFGAPWKLKS
ncbi:MAG: hypothetical protein K8R57_07965 [Verrucomicrobia bacterium]|nr:hypothetical protein [Verrucomicrobiota bacterium]